MGFAAAEDQGALVQGLVGGECHLEIVADSHKQQPSLGQVEGRLADDFVEELLVQLLPDWADSALPGLLLLELGFEQLLQVIQLLASGLSPADIEPVVGPIGGEDVGFEHFIQNLRVPRVEIFGRQGIEYCIALV